MSTNMDNSQSFNGEEPQLFSKYIIRDWPPFILKVVFTILQCITRVKGFYE